VRRYIPIGVVLWSIVTQDARAAEVRVPTFADAFHSAGGLQFPAAWAGVWTFADSFFVCEDSMFVLAFTTIDTLCPNEPFEGEGEVCTGSIDDDSANIQCTSSKETLPGCTAHYEGDIVVTRSGDTLVAVSTARVTFDPPGCDSDPYPCILERTTGIRTGPPPPSCTISAIQPSPWGAVKLRYR
jgi:hypothetical protein